MTLLEFDHIDFAEVGSDMDHLFGDIHVAFVIAADFGDNFGCTFHNTSWSWDTI
jgi:hypothetical protein